MKKAPQRLEKLKRDIESRRRQAEAELEVLQEKNKAELEKEREQRFRQVKVLSPISGLVAIRQKRGNFFFAGTQIPDIREGDECGLECRWPTSSTFPNWKSSVALANSIAPTCVRVRM